MHKDQKRVQDVILPALIDRVLSADPAAVQDCTAINRALSQGPDPLFLALTCPEQFQLLCQHLNLSSAVGLLAIQEAHEKGPGALLVGTGLPLDGKNPETGKELVGMDDYKESWKCEALWLILASFSDCTEDGYTPATSILERMQRAMKAATNFEATLKLYWIAALRGFDGRPAIPYRSAIGDAVDSAKKFMGTTMFTFDERGFPHTDVDHGFYLAYKGQNPVCAVHTAGPTFWGTTVGTSLSEHGIKVDKELSPQFGLVFEDSRAKLAALRAR